MQWDMDIGQPVRAICSKPPEAVYVPADNAHSFSMVKYIPDQQLRYPMSIANKFDMSAGWPFLVESGCLLINIWLCWMAHCGAVAGADATAFANQMLPALFKYHYIVEWIGIGNKIEQ